MGPMTQLLHWGLEHSDPERLKDVMQQYKDNNLTIKDVYGDDFLDALFVDEAGGMRDAIAQIVDFRNATLADDDLEFALNKLQEFIEQVDNAGNLHKMGGLSPLLDLGLSADGEARGSDLQALALWTLGVAVQNNAPVQDDLLSVGGLELLVGKLPSCGTRPGSSDKAGQLQGPLYCGKLLFALSGLVRNNATIQETADSLGLFDWLVDVGIGNANAGVAKKALGLLDTALAQSPGLRFLDGLMPRRDAIEMTLLKAMQGHDEDLAEKGLRVVNRLLGLRPILFKPHFKAALEASARALIDNCERTREKGDEVCEGIAGIWKSSDLMLAALDADDSEL